VLMFPRVRTSGVISVGYCLATVDLDKGSYCNCNTPVIRDSSKYFPFTWLPSDIRNWIRNIEQHASDNVNKILVGNKADMEESKRAVPTAKGQALADEFGIKFFETSAKTNMNVEDVFFTIARDIKQRLAETDSKPEPSSIKVNKPDLNLGQNKGKQKAVSSSCCS
jgi:Ras-related protein Rab-8A